MPGEPASHDGVGDLVRFAEDVAGFLVALRNVDPAGGPTAGEHSVHRGCPPVTYDDETRRRLVELADRIDVPAAQAVWTDAVASVWEADPVWFHGDISFGNLLVADGRLSAVIDFGTSGVGDPASDLVLAWTFLGGAARRAFADAVDLDPATWARARGWCLWKALISINDDSLTSAVHWRVVDDLLADCVVP